MEFKKIYISGVVQGSHINGVSDQGYREHIIHHLTSLDRRDLIIIDPVHMYPQSWKIPITKIQAPFYHMLNLARESDYIISYLPEASMGSILELYECKGVRIVITPIVNNWAIHSLANKIYKDIQEFKNEFRFY